MRLRRSRLEGFFHKKMTVKKDKEGSTSEEYGTASSVIGEIWSASFICFPDCRHHFTIKQ